MCESEGKYFVEQGPNVFIKYFHNFMCKCATKLWAPGEEFVIELVVPCKKSPCSLVLLKIADVFTKFLPWLDKKKPYSGFYQQIVKAYQTLIFNTNILLEIYHFTKHK